MTLVDAIGWFQDKVMFGFGLYGGGFAVALVFLLLASLVHRRPRIILCAAAWLMVAVQSWWLFMLAGLASLGHDHYPEQRIRFERMAFGGIILALAITSWWSYLLFRKARPAREPISVPYP